jgi:N-formylglutamate amidohydrolase
LNRFPILISIPHGGLKKPPELINKLCISDNDLFDDIDPYVVDIYNISNKVEKVIFGEIARTFVDLNRSLLDLPSNNPDGIIKSMTCYQKPIYQKQNEPDLFLTQQLIEKYYKPYHREIQKSLQALHLQVCFDCHSMSSVAPNISPDGNSKARPLFCLSNQNGQTSSNEMLKILAKSISHSFSIESKEITFNNPFKGGYITKTYGNNPVPWIQIEMNRKMYLEKPWFDKEKMTIEKSKLKELNKMFAKSIDLFCSEIQ